VQDQVNKTLLRLSLEVSPASAFKDLFLIDGEVVDAVPLQLVSIVSMSDEEDVEGRAGIDELL
jgi:hypothetical protein